MLNLVKQAKYKTTEILDTAVIMGVAMISNSLLGEDPDAFENTSTMERHKLGAVAVCFGVLRICLLL